MIKNKHMNIGCQYVSRRNAEFAVYMTHHS